MRSTQADRDGTRTITGAAESSVPSIAYGSGDFSIRKNGAGDANIVFMRPFLTPPSVVIGNGGSATPIIAKLSAAEAPTRNGFRVVVVNLSNTLVDGAFTFTAQGRA